MRETTILVMEDAAAVRCLIIKALDEIDGVGRIFATDNTSSALKLLAEHRPHIAVLDIKVPGSYDMRNGIEVLQKVKATYPETAVIMLTNYATAKYRTECLRLGADYFLDKSNEFDKLPAAVEELMQRAT